MHTLTFARNKHEPSQLALHRLQPFPLSSSPSSQNPKHLPRLVLVLATLVYSRELKLTQSWTKFVATNREKFCGVDFLIIDGEWTGFDDAQRQKRLPIADSRSSKPRCMPAESHQRATLAGKLEGWIVGWM